MEWQSDKYVSTDPMWD